MYKVTLEDGKFINCTLKHKFITDQGEKTLEEILNNYHNKDSNTFSIKLLTSYSYE